MIRQITAAKPRKASLLQSSWDAAAISACLVRAYELGGNKLPTIAHMREVYGIAESQFTRHFANFTDACKAAGLPSPLQNARWSRRQMIDAALVHAATYGCAPSSRAWTKAALDHPSAMTVRTRWPSWQTFIDEAGLGGCASSEATQRMWTHDMIIKALIRWANEHGSWPRKRDWSQRGTYWPADSVVRDIFGQWSRAVGEAQGVCSVVYACPKVGGSRSDMAGRRAASAVWTAELILEAARAWRTQHGRWPIADDWRGAGAAWPGYRSVRREFASWPQMLEAAGRAATERTRPVKRKAMSYQLAQRVFARDDNTCQNPYCEGLCSRMSVDHIVAVADGGPDSLDNLQALCVTCNSRKGRRTWNAFMLKESERTQALAQ